MQVIVIFEFKGVNPDGVRADQIVEQITGACETMRIGFDADECWVDDARGEVKVPEMEEEESELDYEALPDWALPKHEKEKR